MPASVSVNQLTVVHKDSTGIATIFPDVCKTPSPAGPIPIPYPNIAMSKDTADGSSSVSMDGNPIMLKSSNYALSTGDEAGSAMGVVSNKIKGKAYPKLYSFDVKVDGENVFRLSDIMLQNGGSPTNTPPGTNVQPPNPALGGAATSPKQPEVTKIKWDKTECVCGDEVKIDVEAQNVSGSLDVPMNLLRSISKRDMNGHLTVKVNGSSGSQTWISKRYWWEKTVKLTAEQPLYKGKKFSENDVTIKTIPDAKETKGPFTRSTPQYVQALVGGVASWVPSGSNYGWDVCYDLEIKSGAFSVTRHLQFNLVGGAKATDKRKQAWKKEIESIWDRKFKIHRKDCKRGKTCDCYAEHWCCAFAIRVHCIFGAGPGKMPDLHAGANDKTWGSPKWWYSHTWWEKSRSVPATVRAHEFGHLIGMYDEYPAGACDPLRAVTNAPDSIMNAGRKVYDRHMKEFHDWFKSKAGSVLGDTELLEMK